MRHLPFYQITQKDITKLVNVDVIVNAANQNLLRGGGVCGAIFKAAGKELDKECQDYIKVNGPLKVSGLFTSQSYNLKEQGIKHIIHVVGPIYDESKNPMQELEKAIKNVIEETFIKLKLNSVAIPAISSGIYGFPKDKCAEVFKRTIPLDKDIRICILDPEIFKTFIKIFQKPNL